MASKRFDFYVTAGGRFYKRTDGSVDYCGADVKLGHVRNADLNWFGLTHLFHVGKKLDLICGTPTRAWYVLPGKSHHNPRHLIPLKTEVDLMTMYSRAKACNDACLEVYLQDTDDVLRDGDVYKLPAEVRNGGKSDYTDAEIREGVEHLVQEEANWGFTTKRHLEKERLAYLLYVLKE